MIINIDRDSDISIYMQIVNHISAAVEKGLLNPGDKLPTQRELSNSLNIARGTILKAYEELEKNGVIEINKGSGTYVKNNSPRSEDERNNAAILYIDELINKLEKIGMTTREMKALFDVRILEHDNHHVNVRVAVIDCNPEALEIFKIQISHIKNVEFRMFILDDILKYSQPDKVFDEFDIIITTLNHYDQVSGILYPLRKKLFKVAVSPERDTIINIAGISNADKNAKLGMIVRSVNFRNIMVRHLQTFDIDGEKIEYALDSHRLRIARFLKEKHILIIPQCYRSNDAAFKAELQQFVDRGGKVIVFKYQIERGSLIYIEEQIKNIIRNR